MAILVSNEKKWSVPIYKVQSIFVEKTPSIIIGYENFELLNTNKVIKSTFFKNSVYILIYYVANQTIAQVHLRNALEFTVAASGHNVQVKYLMILFNTESFSDNFLDNILKYAWSKKRFNVSIIKMDLNNKSRPYVYTFNSFFGILIRNSLFSNIETFPNMISNVNNYALKFPTLDFPPVITVGRDSQNNIINVDTIFFLYLKWHWNS